MNQSLRNAVERKRVIHDCAGEKAFVNDAICFEIFKLSDMQLYRTKSQTFANAMERRLPENRVRWLFVRK